MAERAPRMRRSSAEVRSLLHRAAREIFRDKGYYAASTREIAESAGVTEPMLFRHFGSKASMFEQAVVGPFVDFIDSYVQRWSKMDDAEVATDALAREYIDGVYQLLLDNRDLLATVLAERSRQERWPRLADGHEVVEAHLDALRRQVEAFLVAEGSEIMDIGLALRFTMALMLGVALVEKDLFGWASDGQGRQRLVDEMAAFLLRGVGYGTH